MEVQKVKRVTLSGTVATITFTNPCAKYFVKNFTDSDIYVSFESTCNVNTSIKISSGYAQVIYINERLGHVTCYCTKKLYIRGTGEIEVQQLCWE